VPHPRPIQYNPEGEGALNLDFLVWGTKHGTLHMLNTYPTTELHYQT
jgi:hypothetical protein